ncbi:MAG TPA: energy transducer TonB [Candidatus Sulfotelmatobacter sp.]|nr:energy transducer TonB [Candidatus Sulfotelmatobacter sp.]
MPHARRFVLLSLFVVLATFAFADDLNRQLHDTYANKTFVLRGFYTGERLRFDATGAVSGGASAGDWTTDGFVLVDHIHVSGRVLKIKAKRLMVVSAGQKGLRFAQEVSLLRKDLKTARLEVEASLGLDNVTTEQVHTVLGKIFLTSRDHLADLIPAYWQPCLVEGISAKNERCSLSAELTAVPGMTAPMQSTSEGEQEQSTASTSTTGGIGAHSGPFKIGKGVKPPRVLYQQEPEFTDPARKAKYQGVMTMGLIVDKEGHPYNIHILSPVGAGLDAKAVHAVETWKFQPAEKDGEPVAVQIAVEVDFHLY